MTFDFIFLLLLYSHEDVSFKSICLNVLEDIKQFSLLMWFKKNQLETLFKGEPQIYRRYPLNMHLGRARIAGGVSKKKITSVVRNVKMISM